MAEIAAVPPNGFTVMSTFSGCGGSCLGFELAGFRVLWANEFVPAAREVYALNHPGVLLDPRNIRQVTAEEILAAAGRGVGDIDVLEGSPPCASFSTAGKREEGWGQIRTHSDTAQRADDLFFEFVPLVDGIKPRVFVAENVSGLVKGTAKGYFKRILAAMRACGYRVEARLLDAQWLGVPQQRQRIVFVGVRGDLGVEPAFPRPLPYRYTVREALPALGRVVHDTGGRPQYSGGDVTDRPATTVLQGRAGSLLVEEVVEIEEATGFRGHPFAPPDRPLPAVQASRPVRVATRVVHDTGGDRSRGDVTDRPCPTITVGVNGLNASHYRVEETDLTGYAIGAEWDGLAPGEQSARYFNLVRAHPDAPCPTVTAIGGQTPAWRR
jgi:DNA (cytosine-5)-methyltransferase 1